MYDRTLPVRMLKSTLVSSCPYFVDTIFYVSLISGIELCSYVVFESLVCTGMVYTSFMSGCCELITSALLLVYGAGDASSPRSSMTHRLYHVEIHDTCRHSGLS